MATKEEHFRDLLTAHNDMNATLSKRFLGSSFDAHAKTLAERDEAREKIAELEQVHASADDRIEELKRELKNAREAHGIAEQKVDEMVHPKPPASAEVEGPFKYNEVYGAITSSGKDVAYTSKSFADPDCLVRLLNLGVKSEGMQKRIEELERRDGFDASMQARLITQEKSRADAAEAHEKALREKMERGRRHLQYIGNYYGADILIDILAGREPNQPAD